MNISYKYVLLHLQKEVLEGKNFNWNSKIMGEWVMVCAIWYYLYNCKNVKNPHGGVILLVKLQVSASACNFKLQTVTLQKVTLHHGCFSRFLNCTNGT